MASSVDGALSVAMIPIGRSLRPKRIFGVHSNRANARDVPQIDRRVLDEAIKDTDITLLEHLSLHREERRSLRTFDADQSRLHHADHRDQ